MSDDRLRAGAMRQQKLLVKLQREQHDRILRDVRHIHHYARRRQLSPRLVPLPAEVADRSRSAMDCPAQREETTLQPLPTSMTPAPSTVTRQTTAKNAASNRPALLPSVTQRVSNLTAEECRVRASAERDEKSERSMILNAWRMLVAVAKRSVARAQAHAELIRCVSQLWREEICGRVQLYRLYIKARTRLYQVAAASRVQALSDDEQRARRSLWGLFCRSYLYSSRGAAIRLLEQHRERLRVALECVDGAARIRSDQWQGRVDIYDEMERSFRKVRVRWAACTALSRPLAEQSGGVFVMSPSTMSASQRGDEAHLRSQAGERRRLVNAALAAVRCIAAQEGVVWQLLLRWRRHSIDEANLKARMWRMEQTHRATMLELPLVVIGSPIAGDSAPSITYIHNICDGSERLGDVLSSCVSLNPPARRDIDAADEDELDEEACKKRAVARDGSIVVDRNVVVGVSMDDTWVPRAYISWVTSEFRVKRAMASETEQRVSAAAGDADIANKKLKIAAKTFQSELKQLPEGSVVAELLQDVPGMLTQFLVSALWDLFSPENSGLVPNGLDDSLEASVSSLRSARSFVAGNKGTPKRHVSSPRMTGNAPEIEFAEEEEDAGIGKSTPQSGVARLTAIDESARSALEKLQEVKQTIGAATMSMSLEGASQCGLRFKLFIDPNDMSAILALRDAQGGGLRVTTSPSGTVVAHYSNQARLDVLQDIARAVRVKCDNEDWREAAKMCPASGLVVSVRIDLEADVLALDSVWLPGIDLYNFCDRCNAAEQSSFVTCRGSVSVGFVVLPPTFVVSLDQPLPHFDCREAPSIPVGQVLQTPLSILSTPISCEVPTAALGHPTRQITLASQSEKLGCSGRLEVVAYDGATDSDTFILLERDLKAKGLECIQTTAASEAPEGRSAVAFQILDQSTMVCCAVVELEGDCFFVESVKDGLSLLHLRAIVESIHFSCKSALGSAGVRVFECLFSAPQLPPLRFFFGFSVKCRQLLTTVSIRRELVFRSPMTTKGLVSNEDLLPPRPQFVDVAAIVANSDKTHVTGATLVVEISKGLLHGDFLDVAVGPDGDGSNEVTVELTQPLPMDVAVPGYYTEQLTLMLDGTVAANVAVTYVAEKSSATNLGSPFSPKSDRQSGWIEKHPSFASLRVRHHSSVPQSGPELSTSASFSGIAARGHSLDAAATDENGEPVPLKLHSQALRQEEQAPSSPSSAGGVSIVASKRILVSFVNEVPFGHLQRILRAITFTHGQLAFVSSSARISITVSEGDSRSHVDAHGRVARNDGDTSPSNISPNSSAATTHEMTLLRAGSFLVPDPKSSAYGGVSSYKENSGRKLLFPKFEEFRDAFVQKFTGGGYVRVELVDNDADDCDHLSLDIPETRMKRHRYLASDIAKLLPNAIGSQAIEAKKRVMLAASMAPAALPSVFDAPTVAEAYDAAAALTARRRLTRSRRSLSVRRSTLLQSHHRSSSRAGTSNSSTPVATSISSIEALAEITQSVNFSMEISGAQTKKDSLSATAANATAAQPGKRLWGVIRATVGATRTIRHFGLGLKSAASMVQQRHSLELSGFGLDGSFVRLGMPTEAYKLADATSGAIQGVLFTSPTCLVVSFACGGAAVAASTVLELIQSIAYENNSRAPVILDKRILLSVAHVPGGECYHVQRVKIIPFDDPTEINVEWPALSYRIGTTEVEPYPSSLAAQRVLQMREMSGASSKLPESELLGSSSCCCAPRLGGLLLFAPWLTSVFDPDTDHWDGGFVSIIATRGTYNNRGFISLLSEERQEVLRSQLLPRFHCILPQFILHVEEAPGGIGPSRVLFSSPVHGSRLLLGTLTTPMTPVQLGETAAPKQAAGKAAKQPAAENQNILVFNLSFEPSHLDRWITVDILSYVINCITFAAFAGGDDGSLNKPLMKHYRLEVHDADNPLCGFADVTVDCLPRMITMQPLNASASALIVSSASAIEGVDVSCVLPYSLGENATSILGESLLLRALLGIQDKDKISGGFIEVCVMSGWHAKDSFIINFGQSGITVNADGLLKAKEGPLGRLYQSQGYVRIDLPGYPFEGKGKTASNSLTVDQQLTECISPRRAAEEMGQAKRPSIFGKRVVQLMQAIRFCVTDSKDPTVLGVRRLTVTISDGRFDPCGRLEASSFPMAVLVVK